MITVSRYKILPPETFICPQNDPETSSRNTDASITNAAIIGWGTLYSNGPLASELREATVAVESAEQCRAAYGSSFTKGMVCESLDRNCL